MTARPIVSGSTPTFAVWISNRDTSGAPSGNPHVGETGIASADVKIYAAAPGASLPGSPISNTHYTWTERGRGHYDLAFSDASYFTGAGISRVSVAFDDGVYSYPLVEVFYFVGAHPADVRTWLGTAVAALSSSGYVQTMLMRWLTDNAAGTPAALTATNKYVQVALQRWLTDDAAGTPAALTATGKFLQALVSRWATDDAAGTVITPTSAGRPRVDSTHFGGTVAPTPTVPGIPRVEVASAMNDSISAGSLAAAAVTKIVDGFMTRAHDTGVTLGGLWKRLESWITGAKSESGPVDARVYDWKDRDGNTAFTGTVDTTTGARSQSNVSGSEPP